MRRFWIAMLAGIIVLGTAGTALALPGESPDDTWEVNDDVRAIATDGDRLFIGGKFTVARHGGSSQSSRALVAFSPSSGAPVWTAQVTHGSTTPVVYGLAVDGNIVYLCGQFTKVNGASRTNVAAVNAATGSTLSFSVGGGHPVCNAIAEQSGTIYTATSTGVRAYNGSGSRIGGFNTSTNAKVRSIAPNGSTLFIAGHFSTVNGQARRVLAEINSGTGSPTGWEPGGFVGTNAFGIDVTRDGNVLYAAIGGSDFAGAYQVGNGAPIWKTDTSGSAQVITPFGDGNVIVGGHFNFIADDPNDQCGSNQNPSGECVARGKLAALSVSSGNVQSWNPRVTGHYNGVWTALSLGGRLHIGGEFTKVHGASQTYYARLS